MKNYVLALGLLAGFLISVSGVEAHYAPYGSYLHSRIHRSYHDHTDGTPDLGYPPVDQLESKTYRKTKYGVAPVRYEEILLSPLFPTGGSLRNYPGKPWSSTGTY